MVTAHKSRLTQGVLLLALLALGACSRSSGSSHHSFVRLEASLGQAEIVRDPNGAGPDGVELSRLGVYDDALEDLARQSGFNLFYDGILETLRVQVGIDPRYCIVVANDFRDSLFLEGEVGGVAGDCVLLLDGKLLDVLLEYATYLTLVDIGFVVDDSIAAVDEIVFLHNGVSGATTGGFLYRYGSLPLQVRPQAEFYLLNLLQTVFYHQFGHLYLDHTLAALRDLGSLDPVVPRLEGEEDDADLVAGMLVRKANGDLFRALEVIDIVTFFVLQRFEPDFTYGEVFDPAYQDTEVLPPLASIAVRRQLVTDGFRRFDLWWY